MLEPIPEATGQRQEHTHTHPGEVTRADTTETIISSVLLIKLPVFSQSPTVYPVCCVYLWSRHKHLLCIFPAQGLSGTSDWKRCCARSHRCVCAQKEPPEFREESQSASFIPALQTTNSRTHKQTHTSTYPHTHTYTTCADGPSLQVPGVSSLPPKKTYICLKIPSLSDCNT